MTNVLNLLHRAGQIADEAFDTNRGDATVTPRQQAVLAAIAERDDPSQTDLVNATGIDRSTMADLVRRLSRNGLVTRKRARQDARRYALRLTDKGRVETQRAIAAAETTSGALLFSLPVNLRRPFLRALGHLAHAAAVTP